MNRAQNKGSVARNPEKGFVDSGSNGGVFLWRNRFEM